MVKRPAKQSSPKVGKITKDIELPALQVQQGDHKFYVFSMGASLLWKIASIARRSETEDKGYQRVLSNSRVAAVAEHINLGYPIPNSILLAIDNAHYDCDKSTILIRKGTDAWVIDGQHRLAGAYEASDRLDVELCVIAFIDSAIEFQIEQFVTINREAKGVPTSLVYDLLQHLPSRKKPSEIATERAADIANSLRRDELSPFRDRIVVSSSPQKGKQLSITNFVRKIAPLVHPDRGSLKSFSITQSEKIIDNYFKAIKKVFEAEWRSSRSVFFSTLGFGAIMNIFDDIFLWCISSRGGFKVEHIVSVLEGVENFDFSQWRSLGTGNKAEIEAAKDLRTELVRSRQAQEKSGNKAGLQL